MEELTKQIEENKKIKQQLKQKQDQVKGMELELQERKKEIIRQEEDNEVLEREIKGKEDKIKSREKELDDLEKAIKEKKEKRARKTVGRQAKFTTSFSINTRISISFCQITRARPKDLVLVRQAQTL